MSIKIIMVVYGSIGASSDIIPTGFNVSLLVFQGHFREILPSLVAADIVAACLDVVLYDCPFVPGARGTNSLEGHNGADHASTKRAKDKADDL